MDNLKLKYSDNFHLLEFPQEKLKLTINLHKYNQLSIFKSVIHIFFSKKMSFLKKVVPKLRTSHWTNKSIRIWTQLQRLSIVSRCK